VDCDFPPSSQSNTSQPWPWYIDALAFAPAAGREWLNKAPPPTSHEITFASLDACGSAGHPARDAPMSPALACRSIEAMVRSCQCSSEVALSASKSGHRMDAGLTREAENGKRSLGTRGTLLCGCRNNDRIRACRATNAARHAGIGVPTHHKRTVTLRPPHEHRGGRALARAGFE
jgi:hypothetical protein